MNIEKMKAVLAVAEAKSFSEAAFDMSLSQSAVSKQVASVEDELGVSLFLRSKTDRTVSLTAEGEIFVECASEIVRKYENMNRRIRNASRKGKQPFIVNSLPVPTYGRFNPSVLVSTFFVEHPSLEVQVVNYPQEILLDTLLDEKVDVAIVRALVSNGTVLPPEAWLFDARMEVWDICENACLIAMAEDHPLADRQLLHLEDLKDEVFLMQRPVNSDKSNGTVRFNLFRRACVNAGFEPEFVKPKDPTYYQGEIAFSLVKRGQGVMVSHIPIRDEIEGIRLIPLVGLDWFAKTVVVAKKNHRREDVEKLVKVLQGLVGESK